MQWYYLQWIIKATMTKIQHPPIIYFDCILFFTYLPCQDATPGPWPTRRKLFHTKFWKSQQTVWVTSTKLSYRTHWIYTLNSTNTQVLSFIMNWELWKFISILFHNSKIPSLLFEFPHFSDGHKFNDDKLQPFKYLYTLPPRSTGARKKSKTKKYQT